MQEWEFKGIKIRIQGQGVFTARVGDDDFQADSLEKIQRLITKAQTTTIKKGVKVFYREGSAYSRENQEYVEFEITSVAAVESFGGQGVWLKDTKTGSRSKERMHDLLKHEPEKIDELREINKKILELEKREKDLKKELKLEIDEVFKMLGIEKEKGGD